nr:hypothetical protein Iba_chr03bCG6840 [Ipomoea batatas]
MTLAVDAHRLPAAAHAVKVSIPDFQSTGLDSTISSCEPMTSKCLFYSQFDGQEKIQIISDRQKCHLLRNN